MSNNDLYQEMILDHYKNPRNCCELDPHNHEADGENPLCGDQLKIYLQVENDTIQEISFKGSGCAISQASASMMTDNLKGKSIEEAMKVYENVHKMLTGLDPEELDPSDVKAMGKVRVLEGVSEFPMRVKCASLAWHTMKAALDKKAETISTEL